MNVDIAEKLDEGAVHVQATPEIYYTLLKYFARITQFLSWPFIFIFFYTFFDLQIKGRENLEKQKSPFIVISNHISFYDSFVFRLILEPFTIKLPFRFMAVKNFENFYLNILTALWITDLVYAVFGVFIIEEGKGIEKNLEEAQRIIKNGGNVVIYPEGKMVYDGQVGKFKLGAAVLAQKTGVPVLPVSMRFGKKKFLNTEFIINVGEKIEVDKTASAKDVTDAFSLVIAGLHENGVEKV